MVNRLSLGTDNKLYVPEVIQRKELCDHCTTIKGTLYKLKPGINYTFNPSISSGWDRYSNGLKLYFTVIKNSKTSYDLKIRTDPELTDEIKQGLNQCDHMHTFTNSATLRHINNDGTFQSREIVEEDPNDNFGNWDGREIIIKDGGIVTLGGRHIVIAGDRMCTDYWTNNNIPPGPLLVFIPNLGTPLTSENCNLDI